MKASILAVNFLLVILTIQNVDASYNTDVGQSLDGRIVHFETLRYRGYWVTNTVIFFNIRPLIMAVAERDTYYTSATQFKIKHISSSWVTIESVNKEHHYLMAGDNRHIFLTYSTYPDNNDKALWEIKCTGSDMENCLIRNKNYNTQYFDAFHDKYLQTTFKPEGIWAQFRILAPNPTDSYTLVWETSNGSSLDQSKSITMKEGISETSSSTHEISATVTAEISYAFASASASVSSLWSTTSSKTWESEISFTYDITVKAGTVLRLKQLVGTYGIFSIKANQFAIEEEAL